jgi:hypothetical protein
MCALVLWKLLENQTEPHTTLPGVHVGRVVWGLMTCYWGTNVGIALGTGFQSTHKPV